MTLAIFTLMIFYASIKFVHLTTRHNPTISSHLKKFNFDSNEQINLSNQDVHVAFAVEGFLDGEVKDDPAYVKYLVRLYGKKNGTAFEHILGYHACMPDELKLFGEPSKESEAPFKKLFQEGSKKYMFCLELDDLAEGELSIYGVENDDNYQRWEFVLLPCNYVHVEFGQVGDTIHEKCISDRQKQMDYLGNMNIKIFVTDSLFDKDKFGQDSIVR